MTDAELSAAVNVEWFAVLDLVDGEWFQVRMQGKTLFDRYTATMVSILKGGILVTLDELDDLIEGGWVA